MSGSHATHVTDSEKSTLQNGLAQLLKETTELDWKALPSERYPHPLRSVFYRNLPAVTAVRSEVEARMADDPVAVLGKALVLLELHEAHQPDAAEYFPEDMPFIRACFASKRCNGWIAITGDTDREELEEVINQKWQFRFFNGRRAWSGIYTLLSMLARYAFIYGGIETGDSHALSHFVEDFCPGLLVCRGTMSDLELTLSLAAMNMGLPAVVPPHYPFGLGRVLRAGAQADVRKAVVGFRNIRRLLDTPEIPGLPDYCDLRYRQEEVTAVRSWGDTEQSYFIVRKGVLADQAESQSPVSVRGEPRDAMGIVMTIDAEPMDAFDRVYIEETVHTALAMVEGVRPEYDGTRLAVHFGDNARLTSDQVGEVLLASLRHEFPLLNRSRVEMVFDRSELELQAPKIESEKLERQAEIEATTEENCRNFYQCVGCSPFAPDHVCVLTPERPPQCGRPYGKIKTGAHYAYDDMTNIHHSWMHETINSYRVIEKGIRLDPEKGEWSGVNEAAAKHTHGRTPRIFLHSLGEHPHTGCGCFRLILFRTAKPQPGIGIMEAGFEGAAPDGRRWDDLHYALGGKQAPGIAGAAPAYLSSDKFLRDHGGWKSVVWVSPKVAELAGDRFQAPKA